eukprot:2741907-Prymnesium_polylepis.1
MTTTRTCPRGCSRRPPRRPSTPLSRITSSTPPSCASICYASSTMETWRRQPFRTTRWSPHIRGARRLRAAAASIDDPSTYGTRAGGGR